MTSVYRFGEWLVEPGLNRLSRGREELQLEVGAVVRSGVDLRVAGGEEERPVAGGGGVVRRLLLELHAEGEDVPGIRPRGAEGGATVEKGPASRRAM